MQKEIQDLLKPEILNSIKGLELLAKMVIGAFASGFNQSIYSGQGFEFRQYRSYQPGDDLRLLDWKMFARSDRYYVKEAEAETNVIVRFVLDASASMQHKENNGIQKIEFMRLMAASLAYLAIQQGDAIGLDAFNENKIYKITPKTDRLHFQRFLYELLQINTEGRFASPSQEHLLNNQSGYKELYIFITDMYEEDNEISRIIKQTVSAKNEVLVFHLMAENELKLNYETAFTFEDLESKNHIQSNPIAVRKEYMQFVEIKLAEIKRNILDMGVNYDLCSMNEPMDTLLRSFLLRRKRLI